MKKTVVLLFAVILTLLSSCGFNQSVYKDLVTGALSRGDGLSVDKVSIRINGELENRNEFIFGEKIDFIFSDVFGFEQDSGKAFPGLSMYIIKNEKDTVLAEPNLLQDVTEGTDLSPLELRGSVIARLPFENKEKYKLYLKIWDKKGDGIYTYELPFTIKENEVLNIESDGLTYSKIYLWNETKQHAVVNNKINKEDVFIVIIDSPNGFKVIDEKVFPIFSIRLRDEKEHVILYNENLLSDYEERGINQLSLSETQLSSTISFTGDVFYNPCKLEVLLKDKNSNNKISISANLELE